MKLQRPTSFTTGIHILIWSLLLGIPTLLFREGTYLGLSHNFFLASSIYHIGIFYLNAYVLYPGLLRKRTWWLYIVVIAVAIAGSYHAKLFLLKLDPDFHQTAANSRAIMMGMIPFIIASILFRLINDRIRFEKLEKEARAERLTAELKFLRSQVNPHFLFNMMANMVSLARQKSDLLEPSLIKLSELLRYMLYDSSEGAISVSSEIAHLENYIALQQLRFGEDLKLYIEINDDCPDCLIEPMLLVPFIENAFKHGVGMVKAPYIDIKLVVKANTLDFSVVNNYNGNNFSKDKSSGIGLENVRNRLSLLYPGKSNLRIQGDESVFSVSLTIDLS